METELQKRNDEMNEQKKKSLEQKQEGNKLFGMGQYTKAAEHYSKAIGLNPSDCALYSNRSACYTHLKMYEQAVNDAKLVTRLDSSFVKGWGRLGTALMAQGMFEEAVPAFLQGFKLDPKQTEYQRQAAACQDKCKKGLGIAGEDTRKSFYTEKHRKQGLEEFKKGNFVSAVRYFTQAIDLDITNHVLISNRSAALCKQAAHATTSLSAAPNLYRQALADADRCISLAPEWGKGYARKGAALFGLTNYKESRNFYKLGLEREPSNKHCADGLKEVELVISNIAEEKEEWLDKKEENKKQDKEAEQHPDMCVIPDKKLPSVFCYKCGKEGHFPSNCREKIIQGIKGGGYAHGYQTCHYCGEMGHSKSNCPERLRKMGATKARVTTIGTDEGNPNDNLPDTYCHTCGSHSHLTQHCNHTGLSRSESKQSRKWQDSYDYDPNKRQKN
eukprot:TRINITY_DN3246_c1_g1_i5.p1 TRINITY_DN3246_c1_g1~~TRINITY_DN3246_c1_g1_i5.p1  ORF type:complete len:444 (+),score=82.33 TRINITY_DN3246_c1_g1_i5:523-1854(+)